MSCDKTRILLGKVFTLSELYGFCLFISALLQELVAIPLTHRLLCIWFVEDQFVKRYFHGFILYPLMLCISVLFDATCYVYTLILYVLYARNAVGRKLLITQMFHSGIQLLISNLSVIIMSVVAQKMWNSDIYYALTALLKSLKLGEQDPSYDLIQIQQIFQATDFTTTICNWPMNSSVPLRSGGTNLPRTSHSGFDTSPIDCMFHHYKLHRTSVVANIAVNQGVVSIFVALYTSYIQLKSVTESRARPRGFLGKLSRSKRFEIGWTKHLQKAYRVCSQSLSKLTAKLFRLASSSQFVSVFSVSNRTCMNLGRVVSSSTENVRQILYEWLKPSSTHLVSSPSQSSGVRDLPPTLSRPTSPTESSVYQSVDERYYSLSPKFVDYEQLYCPTWLTFTRSLQTMPERYPIRRRYPIIDILGLDYDKRFSVSPTSSPSL